MLQVALTSQLRRAAGRALASPSLPRALRNELASYVSPPVAASTGAPDAAAADDTPAAPAETHDEDAAIPVAIVQQLAAFLQSQQDPGASLHRLLHGSRIVFESAPARVTPPELEERRKKLRANMLNREYQRMVANVTHAPPEASSTIAGSIREMRAESRTVIAIVNMMFSIVGVFVAVFVAGAAVFDDYSAGRWRQRVLLALVAALVTVIAEGWLFVRYADTTVLDARLRQGPPPRSVQGAIPASASIPGVITRASSESSLASTDTGASFEMTPLVRPAAAGAGVQPH